jgi:TrpR-related protein YerC/YecD
MTKVSKKQLQRNIDAYLQEQLWRAITLLGNKQQVKEFLRDILTNTEIVMLSKRLQVIKMLEEGCTYKQISKALNMSEATINKLYNQYNLFGAGFKNIIPKLQKIESSVKKHKKSIIPASSRAAINFWVGSSKALTKVYKSYSKQRSAEK